jgi:hypothetical protein
MPSELPQQEFEVGDPVEVMINQRNSTSRMGLIARAIWHHKDVCYNYYLEVDGKQVSKRYFASDLARVPLTIHSSRTRFTGRLNSSVSLQIPALRDFEIKAIRLLAGDTLSDAQLALLERIPEPSRYEYTGSGYFLTLSDSSLPAVAETLSYPDVVGEYGEITCGFVVFVGNHELTLECHTWGAVDVPSDFRDCPVSISTPPVNVVDLR